MLCITPGGTLRIPVDKKIMSTVYKTLSLSDCFPECVRPASSIDGFMRASHWVQYFGDGNDMTLFHPPWNFLSEADNQGNIVRQRFDGVQWAGGVERRIKYHGNGSEGL